MKKIFLVAIGILFLTNCSVLAQIQSGQVVKPTEESKPVVKEKKPRKEKKYTLNDSDSTGKSYFSLGGGLFWSQPLFKETNTLFSKPLGLEKDEKGIITPYLGVNYKVGVGKGIFLNFGLDYFKTGERFSWKSTTSDSSYTYKKTYQSISIPLGVTYIYGKNIQFIGGLGFAPNLTFGSHKNITAVTEKKAEKTSKELLRNSVNDFNIATYLQAGVQFKIARGFYFYMLPEFRYSLLNTLNKQAPHARKYWVFGGQIGFSLGF